MKELQAAPPHPTGNAGRELPGRKSPVARHHHFAPDVALLSHQNADTVSPATFIFTMRHDLVSFSRIKLNLG
jgi:hypothetical protein